MSGGRPPRPEGAALAAALEELARGLVPAARAEIAFNRGADGVRDVLVLDKPARLARGVRFGQLGRDKDLGASLWPWPDRPTPEAAWGALMRHGFASPAEGLRALVQFARIQECAWARRAVFEDGLGGDDAERFLARRREIDLGEGLDFAAAERALLAEARPAPRR